MYYVHVYAGRLWYCNTDLARLGSSCIVNSLPCLLQLAWGPRVLLLMALVSWMKGVSSSFAVSSCPPAYM